MGRGGKRALLLGLALYLAAPAIADTLTTIDGRTFQGKLIDQNETRIIFEIHQYGATLRKTFRRTEVKLIVKGALKPEDTSKSERPSRTEQDEKPIEPEPEPPPVVEYEKRTYYIIPLRGVIGMHVTAKYVKRCLDDAATRKADVVVLEVDSPGGFISEVEELVNVIHTGSQGRRVVAYVKKAISAAAITSLACKELYFAPQAIFGAATAYQQDAFGLPRSIAEKFQSAWRARARSAASIGGHNPLLAEAMIDDQMELHMVKHKSGQVSIKTGKSGGGNTKTITTKGKLLTLTAAEAQEVGLAKEVVVDYAQLGEKLEQKDWTECKGHGTLLAAYREKSLSGILRKMEDLRADFERNMERAWDNRPENPSIPYRYDNRSGLYLPESRRRWRNRSRECAGWLLKAEQNMGKLRELASSFEEIKESTDYLRRVEIEVRNIRMDVMRKINKRGPDD